MCKASYRYGTLYCTPFRYSYGCFGFRFDFLCCYTQRKQPQLSTSKGPRQSHIDRPHFRRACCAVPCRAVPCRAVPQTDRSCYGEEETIFSSLKNTPFFFPSQITVLWENYTRKTPFCLVHGNKKKKRRKKMQRCVIGTVK